jgi:hypothetical protein
MSNKLTRVYRGLTLQYIDTASAQEWLQKYYKDYAFMFIFKDGTKTKLVNIKEYKQQAFYTYKQEVIKSPLITLDANIKRNGIAINGFYLKDVQAIEVYCHCI